METYYTRTLEKAFFAKTTSTSPRLNLKKIRRSIDRVDHHRAEREE